MEALIKTILYRKSYPSLMENKENILMSNQKYFNAYEEPLSVKGSYIP